MEKAPMNVGMGGPSRYNAANSQQQASPVPTPTGNSFHFASPRRRYTAGSDSATSPIVPKVTHNPSPPVPSLPPPHVFPPQHFLYLLPQTRNLPYAPTHLSGASVTSSHIQARSSSPPRHDDSPARRRLNPHSPDRGTDNLSNYGQSNGWSRGGRNNGHRNSSVVNRNSVPNMHANGKKEPVQPMARRSANRRNGSAQTTFSSSMPSTPNHHPQLVTGKSRSPSPQSCLLDSPKSAASEPLPLTIQPPLNNGRCKYETALVNCRRRFHYNIGYEYLPYEKPIKGKLSWEEDRKLTREMDELYQRLLPTAESNERRRKFVMKLKKLLNSEWPGHNIEVNVFGSSENHLCTTDSDVDICITTDCKELEHTCKLAKGLAKHGMERVVCVPRAKVPIVKIWDPELCVACDMNVNNTLALENTRMIKTYVGIDPRVRPLAMIIKHWTKQRILNDAAGGATFGSYTWICMILNFLQTRDPPILPSLHERPHKKGPVIDGVDCSFDDDVERLRGFGSKNKESLGSLLFGFFKQYGHDLDYEKDVISVRRGKILTKVEKGWQYGQNNWLCVEEPFNISRNLGNTADAYSVKGLHLEFRRAFKFLAEKVDLNACCTKYEFPPEEPPTFVLPPPVQKTSVRLSQASSVLNRGRGGHYGGSGRGGRSYAGYNTKQSQFRRGSNGSAYSNVSVQPHYASDIHSLQANQLHHLYQLDFNQIQAHMQAQAQAQLVALQNMQPQLNANGLHGSAQSSTFQDSGSASIPSLPALAYYAHVLGIPYFYNPPLSGSESGTVPPSPTCASSVPETRQGLSRGRRFGTYPVRSRSQPPPNEMNSNSTSFLRANIPITLLQPSDDELDYDNLSSNGSLHMNQSHAPPETPPEDEVSDEYVGYYSIGESLQEELEPSQAVLGTEAFIEQNCMVDQQKRLSIEKIPNPLLHRSRSSSPIPMESLGSQQFDNRGPLIVNGSSSQGSPSRLDRTTKTNSSDEISVSDAYPHGNNAPHPKLDNARSSLPPSPSPIAIHSYHNAMVSQSGASLCPSPGTQESADISSPCHQASTLYQMAWSKSRSASADAPISRMRASNQEEVPSILTPVPEVRTPSPTNVRMKMDLPASDDQDSRISVQKSPKINIVKSPNTATKKPVANGVQNNGPHKPSRGKNQGPNLSNVLASSSNSGTVSGVPGTKDNAKSNAYVSRGKKSKKRPSASPGKSETIPEMERKGG